MFGKDDVFALELHSSLGSRFDKVLIGGPLGVQSATGSAIVDEATLTQLRSLMERLSKPLDGWSGLEI